MERPTAPMPAAEDNAKQRTAATAVKSLHTCASEALATKLDSDVTIRESEADALPPAKRVKHSDGQSDLYKNTMHSLHSVGVFASHPWLRFSP